MTLLIVYLSGWTIAVPYPTPEACGDAIAAMAESELGAEWMQCRPPLAPETSPRPRVRPDSFTGDE